MRVRLLVPVLLLSSLAAVPTAHAASCTSLTDAAGDAPSATLDVRGADLAVDTTAGTIVVTLHVGQTDPTGDPFTAPGVSFYVRFLVGPSLETVWRHVGIRALGEPDVFGGLTGTPTATMTADSVTWTMPISAFSTYTSPSDVCLSRAFSQLPNGAVTWDTTA